MADHLRIEKKWTKLWQRTGVYEPDLTPRKIQGKKAKKPYYNLMMFPYPSAEGLHVGNMYAFTGSDIFGRYQRMKGNDVFEPIGLDGFGIHSENYALKVKRHPAKQAKISEKNFYRQLEMIGNGFAWKEHLETYDPEYYKWTQWIFAEMFRRGLAYRKKQAVNWCPSCMTVLADEQVIGVECERCGSKVIKKDLEQWFFKITDYAERLLEDLDKIDWSEKVKIAQRNWIGKSEGAEIEFPIFVTSDVQKIVSRIKVFTTRPDTLFGATYMVLTPEHELIKNLESRIKNYDEVQKYIEAAKKKTTEERQEAKDKTGVELKGIKAINPANNEKIPVWISDYVLAGYGTGAIMAVPAHDERDFEFAKKFGLKIKPVVQKVDIEVRSILMGFKNIQDQELKNLDIKEIWSADADHKYIEIPKKSLPQFEKLIMERMTPGFWNEYVSSENIVFIFKDKDGSIERLELNEKNDKKINEFSYTFNGKPAQEGTTWRWLPHVPFYKDFFIHTDKGVLINSGQFNGMDSEKAKWEITKFVGGEKKTQYRLRDWLISRQRYWGSPIPLVFCKNCAERIMKREAGIKKKFSKGEIENPGWIAVPDKDLPVKLPYIKDYRPKGKGVSPLAGEPKFYKVKCPKCKKIARRETDVSDTFLDSAWYFFRYIDPKNKKTPFDKNRAKKWLPVNMYIGGAEHSVLHLLYVRFITKVFQDWKIINFDEPFSIFRAHGLIVKDGAKMSKSKGNVVNPDEYIKKFGADALRMYLMFIGPFVEGGDFRDAGIFGVTRFLERVKKLEKKLAGNSKHGLSEDSEKLFHQTIKKVTEDIESLRYNTAISQLMILLNKLEELAIIPLETFENFLKLLAPFAPFVTEELYQKFKKNRAFGRKKSIHLQPWPKFDPKKIKESNFQLIVQVDGKVRASLLAPIGISQTEAQRLAKKQVNVLKYINDKNPRKVIFVPNKLINFVL